MKKLLVVFILLLSLSATASAVTVSHRYIIPGTEYTVEFPYFFAVASTEMNQYEPIVFEWKVTLEDAKEVMDSFSFDMIAMEESESGVTLYVQVTQYQEDIGFSTQELSDDSLENLGADLAEEYYASHQSSIPINEDDIASVFERDHAKFINWGYVSDYDGVAYSEHYVLIEHTYMINIIVDYKSMDYDAFTRSSVIVYNILDSVNKGFMNYSE